MKKGLFFSIMLVGVLALGFSQTVLSGIYRYSANAYITFTGNAFTGLWNATTPISGTYSVSGSRLSLNITGGPKASNTWAWTIVDANTLRDQDNDTWKKEGTGGSAQVRTSPPVEWNVNNTATWIEVVGGVRSGGNNKSYVIIITGDISVPMSNESTFGSVTGITITMQGNGSITPSSRGRLIVIGSGQTVILKGDITLQGRNDNDASLVRINNGGTFRMEGNSTIMGNTSRDGGGVYINGGTFTMSDGFISGNSCDSSGYVGGGVYVGEGGTFTMSGGTISGNTCGVRPSSAIQGGGGGVYVDGKGILTMSGGTISSNTSSRGIGGVYVRGKFTMSGGTISSNMGGGVYVYRGEFLMKGGTISSNTANNGGGVSILF